MSDLIPIGTGPEIRAARMAWYAARQAERREPRWPVIWRDRAVALPWGWWLHRYSLEQYVWRRWVRPVLSLTDPERAHEATMWTLDSPLGVLLAAWTLTAGRVPWWWLDRTAP